MKTTDYWLKMGGITAIGLTLVAVGYAAIPGYALLAYFVGRTQAESDQQSNPQESNNHDNTKD